MLEQKELLVKELEKWEIKSTLEINMGDEWYWEVWTFTRVSPNRIKYSLDINSSSGWCEPYEFEGVANLKQLVALVENRKYGFDIESDKPMLELLVQAIQEQK